MADRVGTEIAGYRIESLIARGGMGEVYLAEQDSPRRKVALKLLSPELSGDAGFRERFARESEAAASIDHPNVIPIYASGQSDGALFIAMRYVVGTDLRTPLAGEGPLPPKRAVRICAQIADALEAAHERGLVHRDVKPANILVGRNDHAYLSDFGLIQRSEVSTGITRTGQFMGTIEYVAPEQIKGQAVDGRADVYSLGCVAYECLTGEPPFRRETEVATLYAHLEDPAPKPSAKVGTVAPELEEVVAKAMAKNPDDRLATAGELGASLRVADQREIVSADGHLPQRRRRRYVAVAIMASLVVVAASTLFLVTRSGTEAPVEPPIAAAPPLNSVVKVDPNTGKVQVTVPHVGQGEVSGGHKPRIVFGEGGVWVLQQNTVWEIDPDTAAIDQTISVTFPPPATFAVGFRAIWMGGSVSGPGGIGEILLFNPSTGAPLDSIPLRGTYATAVSIGGDAVWAGLQDGDVLRLDGPTGDIEDRLPSGATGIDAMVATSDAVWIADKLDGTLLRVDPTTEEVVAMIPITGNIDGLAADDSGVWVLDTVAGNVTPVDPSTNTPSQPIRVGEDPSDIAVGLGSVWVTDQTDGRLYRIDPELRTVSDRYKLGDRSQRSPWIHSITRSG